MSDEWMMLLVFYPSLVLVACCYMSAKAYDEALEAKETGWKMYKEGKRIGRLEVAREVFGLYREILLKDDAEGK